MRCLTDCDLFSASCASCPTRLAASRLLPVNCLSVDGPATLRPATLRSSFCSDSVALRTAMVRNLRSGVSAANTSSGYVGLPELVFGWSGAGGYFDSGCGEFPATPTGIEPGKLLLYILNTSPSV